MNGEINYFFRFEDSNGSSVALEKRELDDDDFYPWSRILYEIATAMAPVFGYSFVNDISIRGVPLSVLADNGFIPPYLDADDDEDKDNNAGLTD